MVRERPAVVRWQGAFYRVAGVVDFAQSVATSLFRWMADTRVSKQAVLGNLEKLYNRPVGTRTHDSSSPISSELTSQISQYFSALSAQNVDWGTFLPELVKALDSSKAHGYEWKPRNGDDFLFKRELKSKERVQLRGKRFARHVLIGVWAVTPDAKSNLLIRLRNLLKRRGGGIFYHDHTKAGEHAYGGFAVVMVHVAEEASEEIRDICRQLAEADGGTFHLSAVRLDGLAASRPVLNSDFHKMHAIHDVNFNELFSLPQIVNGQVPDLKYSELPNRLRNSLG